MNVLGFENGVPNIHILAFEHKENLPTQSWKVSLTALGRFVPFVPFVPFAKKLLKFFRTLAIRWVEDTGSKIGTLAQKEHNLNCVYPVLSEDHIVDVIVLL